MNKYYELELNLYKRGDDFAACLKEAEGDVKQAFMFLADQYTEAAKTCKRMASVVAEYPEIKADGDTHSISVEGPEEVLSVLEKEQILYCFGNEEDEEEEEEFEEEDGEDDSE